MARASNRDEWRRLSSAVDLADSFQFLVVQVGDPSATLFVAELLAAKLDEGPRSLCTLVLDMELRVSELLEHMRAARRPCVFWLVSNTPGRALEPLFSLLNQKREVIAGLSAGPLVIALHPLAWTHFRRCAPDFWSIHQTVFRFSPGREPPERVALQARPSQRWHAKPEPARAGGWRLDPADIPPPPPGFVGREAEKSLLRSGLREPGAKILITGLAGIGKTALVDAVLPTIASRYSGGVWRVPLTNSAPSRVSAILAQLLSELHPRVRPPSELDSLRRHFVLATAKRPALFVFEDLDDPELLETLLPGDGASVIVTSRQAPSPARFDRVIKLGGLTLDDATELLTRGRSPHPLAELTVPAARRIATSLDGVPGRLLGPDPSLSPGSLGGLDPAQLSGDARSLWPLVGWFTRFDQTDAEAVSGWDASRTRAALDELVDLSALESIEANSTLGAPRYRHPSVMHRGAALGLLGPVSLQGIQAIQAFRAFRRRVLIDWQAPPDDPDVQLAVQMLLTIPVETEAIGDEDWDILRGAAVRLSAWPWASPELMSVAQAEAQRRGDVELLAVIQGWRAERAEARGEFDAATSARAARLDALTQIHGAAAHPDVVTAHLDLALLLVSTDLDAAKAHITLAIELADTLEDPQLSIRARLVLANTDVDPSQSPAALARALELSDRAPELRGWVLASKASTSHRSGDFETARRLIAEALETDTSAIALPYELAKLAENIGDHELALRAYEQTLRANEPLGDRDFEAVLMSRLGQVSIARGDLDTAQRWLERGLELNEQLDQAHLALIPLAQLDRLRGDLDGAIAKLIKAYEELRTIEPDLVYDELRACYEAASSEPERTMVREQWERAGHDWDGILP